MPNKERKHAYLIIAHSNHSLLQKLILLIDDHRNDIFLHIDIKDKDFPLKKIANSVKKSNLYFTNRTNVIWGHISQIKAEFILFEFASKKYKYEYYHLLSGVDLPLKSQNYIHDFFHTNEGFEFIGFKTKWNKDRVTRINFFTKYLRCRHKIIYFIARYIRLTFIIFQKLINYQYRKMSVHNFKFGHNWCSVTHNFIIDLINNKENILETYKYSNAPDEIYKQTFAYNSKYRDKIYNIYDDLESCQRLIDWNRGKPYTFREIDYNELIATDKIFARKFDEKIDSKIIDLIFKNIAKK